MVFSSGTVCASLAVEEYLQEMNICCGVSGRVRIWIGCLKLSQEWWKQTKAGTWEVVEKTRTAFTLWLGLMWRKGRIADHYGVSFASPVPFDCTPHWSLEWNIMLSLKPGHTSCAPSHLGSTKTQEQTRAGIIASSVIIVWIFHLLLARV